MNVLIVCFIFGLVHLFTGVVLKGVTDVKNGNKFDALCDTVPTFLTVIGVAPIFFNLFIQENTITKRINLTAVTLAASPNQLPYIAPQNTAERFCLIR